MVERITNQGMADRNLSSQDILVEETLQIRANPKAKRRLNQIIGVQGSSIRGRFYLRRWMYSL